MSASPKSVTIQFCNECGRMTFGGLWPWHERECGHPLRPVEYVPAAQAGVSRPTYEQEHLARLTAEQEYRRTQAEVEQLRHALRSAEDESEQRGQRWMEARVQIKELRQQLEEAQKASRYYRESALKSEARSNEAQKRGDALAEIIDDFLHAPDQTGVVEHAHNLLNDWRKEVMPNTTATADS